MALAPMKPIDDTSVFLMLQKGLGLGFRGCFSEFYIVLKPNHRADLHRIIVDCMKDLDVRRP